MSLPRGIPAASLKRERLAVAYGHELVSLPRGIPAASLKLVVLEPLHGLHKQSSAGNTRGLIEAPVRAHHGNGHDGVFRGEYPRPH